MGYGDEIMATAQAKGARARGRRIAFGDGKKIIWSRQAGEIFQNNPNIARPGTEGDDNLEWVENYSGHRPYFSGRDSRGAWVYTDWKASPGEIFLAAGERDWGAEWHEYVIIEPNVKPIAQNKQWPRDRYQKVADALLAAGHYVCQLCPPSPQFALAGVAQFPTRTFRLAMAFLSQSCNLYIGPEGGLHHAAAAFNVPAVVIFGGYIHPRNTGYDTHVNLYAGGEPCGLMGSECSHCREAMDNISVDQVLEAARGKVG